MSISRALSGMAKTSTSLVLVILLFLMFIGCYDSTPKSPYPIIQPSLSFCAHANTVGSVAFSSNDNLLYTTGGDHSAKSWDARTGVILASRHLSAGAHVIALNPGNGEIACWEDGTLMLRNITGPACRRLDCKGRKMLSAVFLPNNQGLIGLTLDSSHQSKTSLIGWKVDSDMPDWVDQTQDHEIMHLANMGTSVIGFCDNGEVMKWHFDAFPPSNPPRTIWKSEGYSRPIDCSSNKDVLAVATRGGGIEIINLSAPTPISLPPLSNAHDVSCIAISNNADVIVACYMLAPPYYSVRLFLITSGWIFLSIF